MSANWKESIYLKRAELAGWLHDPMARLADHCTAAWGNRQQLNALLQTHFAEVPYVEYLYVLDRKGVQISDNIAADRIFTDYFGRDRSPDHADLARRPPAGLSATGKAHRHLAKNRR